jgi:hypothetical protein
VASGLKNHQIQLKNLHENEVILHNCSSHPIVHLKPHVVYLASVMIPLAILMFMDQKGMLQGASSTVWFLYACYGLWMTVGFFVKGVNFELGGCVVTNQRLLRFGYSGLIHTVEREILPKNISDFKVEKKGILSFLFNTATISIYTANNQIDVLRHLIEPEKIQDAYARMMQIQPQKLQEETHSLGTTSNARADWIDVALAESEGAELNMDQHRKGMIGDIGNVFKKKQ